MSDNVTRLMQGASGGKLSNGEFRQYHLGIVPSLSGQELRELRGRGAFDLLVSHSMHGVGRSGARYALRACETPEPHSVISLESARDLMCAIGGVAFVLSGLRHQDMVVDQGFVVRTTADEFYTHGALLADQLAATEVTTAE